MAAMWGLASLPATDRNGDEEKDRDAATIIGLLADPDERASNVAEEILTLKPRGRIFGYSIDEFAVRPLVNFFSAERNPALRVRALHILTSYDDPSVQQLMDQLEKDTDPNVREIAKSYEPPTYDERGRIDHVETPRAGNTPADKLNEMGRLTQSKNARDRALAAEEMGKSNDVENTIGLVRLLKDPAAMVREKAAINLGVLNGYIEEPGTDCNGNLTDSVPALYASLDDSSAKVRAAALNSLASLYPEGPIAEEIPTDHANVLA
jgi:HEAT repeat protein